MQGQHHPCILHISLASPSFFSLLSDLEGETEKAVQFSLCQSLQEISLHPPNSSPFLHIQATFKILTLRFKTN